MDAAEAARKQSDVLTVNGGAALRGQWAQFFGCGMDWDLLHEARRVPPTSENAFATAGRC